MYKEWFKKELKSKPLMFVVAIVILAFILIKFIGTEKGEDFVYEGYLPVDHINYLDDWPKLKKGFKLNDQHERRIDKIIAKMSIEQKVGQMIQVNASYKMDDPEELHIGSVRFDSIRVNRLKDLDKLWVAFEEYAQENNIEFIPPSYAMEAVRGHSNNIESVMFPHAISLGAENNPQRLKFISDATAKQILNDGYDWHLGVYSSPIRNKLNGDNYLHFSEDSVSQLPLIKHYFQGLLQNDVIATTRGFIGKGGLDNDYKNLDINFNALLNLYGLPHFEALEQGVQVVELSHNSVNSTPNVVNKNLISKTLKTDMGFNGVVMSPLNASANILGCWVGECSKMINAGVDVIYIDSRLRNFNVSLGINELGLDAASLFHKNTVKAVQKGEIDIERINDAVRRVLRVKLSVNLLDKPKPSLRSETNSLTKSEIQDFKKLAKHSAKDSAVLIKNNNVLPISPNQKVLVIGEGADQIYKQIGAHDGVNHWVKTKRSNRNFNATSLVEELKKRSEYITTIYSEDINVDKAFARARKYLDRTSRGLKLAKKYKMPFDGKIHKIDSINITSKKAFIDNFYQRIRRYVSDFDVVVLVMSDESYKSSEGDKPNYHFINENSEQWRLFFELSGMSHQFVIVSYTGNTYYQPSIINGADAFVQAWYPGSNVSGLAELIISNSPNAEFTGTLPVSWPLSPCSTQNVTGVKKSLSAFEFGFNSKNAINDEQFNLPNIDDCQELFWEAYL